MTGDENDGDPEARVSQLALKLEAVDSRKSHVQHKTAWAVRPLAGQKFLRRPEGLGG